MLVPEGTTLLIHRAKRRRAALGARARALRVEVEIAADELAATLGVQRIALFGTLARGAIHEGSDVDLAVWGLAFEREGAALDLLEKRVHASVDLVRMEAAPDSLVRRVTAEGVVLVPRG